MVALLPATTTDHIGALAFIGASVAALVIAVLPRRARRVDTPQPRRRYTDETSQRDLMDEVKREVSRRDPRLDPVAGHLRVDRRRPVVERPPAERRGAHASPAPSGTPPAATLTPHRQEANPCSSNNSG